MICSIILPNQLFNNPLLYQLSDNIYLIEDDKFYIDLPYHKQKLILHRASMKAYHDYLFSLEDSKKKNITYIDSKKASTIYDKLFKKYKIIHVYDPEDIEIEKKFNKLKKKYLTIIEFHHNQLFIETKDELESYYQSLKSHTRYIHDTGFYRWQRIRLNILIDKDDQPEFGKWSFDHDNRKPFDKNYIQYKNPKPNISEYVEEAKIYVENNWPNNFGLVDDFFYPVNFEQAKSLFKSFLKYKISSFGKYEDAVNSNIPFGSHSLLSSSLNIGLIHPKYILIKILNAYSKLSSSDKKKAIPNVEGFIRQLIGWRSYVRFIYTYHGEQMYNENALSHHNKITDDWYTGTTQIYPIDNIIKKVERYGYAHHIERLMYLGNYALLMQIDPIEIYNWFMICFIDSYEWVMIPNVMGMSQYSSKTIKMMTRPYFSSSNYIKMLSNYKLNSYDEIELQGIINPGLGFTNVKLPKEQGSSTTGLGFDSSKLPKEQGNKVIEKELYYWNEIWDALYYNFINKNYNLLKKIYAVARNVVHWDKKSINEKNRLLKIAKKWLYH